jgi:hypothetical protein
MLRVSIFIAALTFLETTTIGGSVAEAQSFSNATAFSFEKCEAVCIKNNGRRCQRWCQRRRALSG